MVQQLCNISASHWRDWHNRSNHFYLGKVGASHVRFAPHKLLTGGRCKVEWTPLTTEARNRGAYYWDPRIENSIRESHCLFFIHSIIMILKQFSYRNIRCTCSILWITLVFIRRFGFCSRRPSSKLFQGMSVHLFSLLVFFWFCWKSITRRLVKMVNNLHLLLSCGQASIGWLYK